MLHRWLARLCVPVVIAAALLPAGGGPAEAQSATAHSVVGIALSPSSGVQTVGSSVSINVTINPPQQLLEQGIVVSFSIESGPNAGAAIPSCTVDAGGLGLGGASSCANPTGYTGTSAGVDTIRAKVTSAGSNDPGRTTNVTWRGIPALIQVTPQASYNTAGGSTAVTASVFDNTFTPVPGASVNFTVTGAGATSGAATTDASGNAPFSFGSNSTGQSTITAAVSGAGGSVVTARATANWAGQPAKVVLGTGSQNLNGLAPVHGMATVVAQVTDGSNPAIPVGDNTPVNFTVTGVGATSGSATTSAGNAAFTFGGNQVGTSTVTASAPPAPDSNPLTITWQVPTATSISLAPKLAFAILGRRQFVVATVKDQFGRPFPGAGADPAGFDVKVRFIVTGANGIAGTLSSTPDANGQSSVEVDGNNLGLDTITAFVDLPNSGFFDAADPQSTANIFWLRKPGQGYWLAASDGGIFNYGPTAQFEGSTGSMHLNQPIVGMARTPTGFGYWLVASDGGIFAFGDAQFYGSTGSLRLNKPIVGMAAMPDGGGYFLVASDGGIFAFGTAVFRGSTGSLHLNQPIVGMAMTPDGGGYWLVASDGGIFAFGNASFQGSTGSIRLNQPIVGMAATGSGGYWLAASDGGIFNFGPGAVLYGSLGAIHLNKPVVGIGSISDGSGYFMAASDGGVFNFGPGAPALFGSAAGAPLNKPVVAIAVGP